MDRAAAPLAAAAVAALSPRPQPARVEDHLLAGTIAGLTSTGLLFPLDLIKTHYQVYDHAGRPFASLFQVRAHRMLIGSGQSGRNRCRVLNNSSTFSLDIKGHAQHRAAGGVPGAVQGPEPRAAGQRRLVGRLLPLLRARQEPVRGRKMGTVKSLPCAPVVRVPL